MTVEQKRALALARARLRLQQQQQPSQPQGLPVTEGADEFSSVENVEMQQPSGFMRGAFYDPVASIAQFAGEGTRQRLAEQERQYQAQREAAGEYGTEWSRIGGSVLSPLNIVPAARVASAAQKTLGAGRAGVVGGAAAAGATSAALTPTFESDTDAVSFLSDKLEQVGVGAVLGVAVQGGIKVGSKVYNFLKDLSAPLTKGGRDRLLREAFDKLTGPEKQKIINAANQAAEIVPGSKPTLAEAVSNIPEATQLAAFQQKLATEVGAAPLYAARGAEQQAARARMLGPGEEAVEMLKAQRQSVTAPMREEALSQANVAGRIAPRLEEEIAQRQASSVQALQQQGQLQARAAEQGVLAQNFYPVPGQPRFPGRYGFNIEREVEAITAAKEVGDIVGQRKAEIAFKKSQLQSLADNGFYPLRVNPIVEEIDSLLGKSTVRASDLKVGTLQELRDKLINLTDENGIIDSNALYEVRKQIGDSIKKFSEATKTTDQKTLAGLETSLKSLFDKTIEEAGGVKWKDYLKNFATYSKKIDQANIGNYLSQRLGGYVDDVERAGAFYNAVRDAASTIRRSGGAIRYEKLGQVLEPEQLAAVNAVNADLQRKAKAIALGTKTKIGGVDVVDTPELPQLLNQTAAISNALLRAFKANASTELNKKAAELMLDPKQWAIFMSSVPKDKANAFSTALYGKLNEQNRKALLAILGITKTTNEPSSDIENQPFTIDVTTRNQ